MAIEGVGYGAAHSAGAQDGALAATAAFSWLGPTVMHGVLGPRRRWRMALRAAVGSPGVLDLASACRVYAGPWHGALAVTSPGDGPWNLAPIPPLDSLALVAPTAHQVLVEVL